MTRQEIYTFINAHRWAIEATVSSTGAPQAAVIGFVASEHLELFFDTLNTSRKYQNLQLTSKISLVIGWDDGCTLQYEGLADEPTGPELEVFKSRYFEVFPDGLERACSEELTYIRIKPVWLRFSDFRVTPPKIVELREPIV
jgi:uncharacterized pyridoxamine 5'-phosphate oxidase family protein